MTSPGPFEVARSVGNQFGKAITEARDSNAIENALSTAASGKPEGFRDAIGNILQNVSPERQAGAIAFLTSSQNALIKQRERDRAKQANIDEGLSGSRVDLPPGVQTALINADAKIKKAELAARAKGEGKPLSDKARERKRGLLTAEGLIKRQRELLKSRNVGAAISRAGTTRNAFFETPEIQAATAEFVQNGRALIPFSSAITIRNQKEFKELSKDLINPDRTIEELTGTLDSLERSIKSQLALFEADEGRPGAGGQAPQPDAEAFSPIEQSSQQPLQGALPETPEAGQAFIFGDKQKTSLKNASGKKTTVLKDDDKGLIIAAMNGFAPDGFVALFKPDGQPTFARIENVQTLLNRGYSVINGPQ